MALKGKTNEEKIWNYLKSKGLNDYGVAGLMGNLYAESALKSNNLEELCERRLKENGKPYCTDELYTSAVDNGTISRAEFLNPLLNKQYGYGYAQWTSPNRKAGLYDLAKSRKVSIADEQMQLDYLINELKSSYPTVLNTLQTATSVKQASDIVLTKFEMPSDCSSSVKNTRASYGQKYYDKYAKSTTTAPSASTANPQKVIAIARNEIGYLEKNSNSNLDSKTGNAGSNNYTKYWRDMANLGLGNYQAQYWCACFVHWCFYKAYGLSASQELLLHSFFINCETLASLASNKGCLYSTPKVGDVILFWKSSKGYYHTGIVAGVTNTTVTTIEGNTSGGSTVIDNGGGVAEKTYQLSGLSAKFMRPDYCRTGVPENDTATQPQTPSNNGSSSLNETVRWDGRVTADELNVRTYAGTEFGLCSFSPIKKDETVGVCDSVKAKDGATWYFIKYNGKFGFVHSQYVEKNVENVDNSKIEYAESFSDAVKGNYKATSDLNLRSGAGTNKPIQCVIPKGGSVICYGYYTSVNGVKWYYVAYKTYTGFVSSEYLTK